jgi:hypothetical protein
MTAFGPVRFDTGVLIDAWWYRIRAVRGDKAKSAAMCVVGNCAACSTVFKVDYRSIHFVALPFGKTKDNFELDRLLSLPLRSLNLNFDNG